MQLGSCEIVERTDAVRDLSNANSQQRLGSAPGLPRAFPFPFPSLCCRRRQCSRLLVIERRESSALRLVVEEDY